MYTGEELVLFSKKGEIILPKGLIAKLATPREK